MAIVRIVLDKELLRAADRAARRTKRNRSALTRDALREHLDRLELRTKEEREREGYLRRQRGLAEVRLWEGKAVWVENNA